MQNSEQILHTLTISAMIKPLGFKFMCS